MMVQPYERPYRDFMVARDSVSECLVRDPRIVMTRGWPPARRLAERLVRWAIRRWAGHTPHRSSARTFSVPTGPILERLRLQQDDLMRVYNQQAEKLYIGPEALSELEGSIRGRMMSLGEFQCDLVGTRGRRVFGIEVVVVPWMTGVLLVPGGRS